MPIHPRRLPRVALLVETSRTYTRELLAGIRRYVAGAGPWSTFIEARAVGAAPPPWLEKWDGDGILTRTFTPETNNLITATGLPAVELRTTLLPHNRPFVGMDNRRAGVMVAEHFLNRGHRHFAVYGLASEAFFQERVQNFVSRIEAEDLPCAVLPEPVTEDVSDWEQHQHELTSLLQDLPKPVGIFAANDQLGVYLLDACLRAGLAVPEEVAVVGCENEETLCSLSTPPLTSVQPDGRRIGYEAARMLDRLMKGEAVSREPLLIQPRDVITRESSDDLVITDRLVAHAVRLIRENATQGLTVEDLCRALNASRSTLERRMKRALRRTPKEEILRLRFREVERLLRDSDLTIEVISEKTGFAHPHYLQTAFRERQGQTPGSFRKQYRSGGGA